MSSQLKLEETIPEEEGFYCCICQCQITHHSELVHYLKHVAEELWMARLIQRSGSGAGVKGG